jgi:hypothetical protein
VAVAVQQRMVPQVQEQELVATELPDLDLQLVPVAVAGATHQERSEEAPYLVQEISADSQLLAQITT